MCPSLRQDDGKMTIVIAKEVTQWSLIVNFLGRISSKFLKIRLVWPIQVINARIFISNLNLKRVVIQRHKIDNN